MRKELGKISKASFGYGGYQGVQFGLALEFEMLGSGVGRFDGHWDTPPSDNANWTEDERVEFFGNLTLRIINLVKAAKVRDVSELVGVPVELSFDGNMLREWRVLEEVL